jgi:two-component system phosphate regulon sensor histidine kinase PhoR
MENHASRPEFMQAMNGSVGVSTRYSNTVGIDFLYVAIPAGGNYLRLALPLSEVQARSNRFRANVIGVILVAMIPAIFGAGWLARRVSARLSQIITFSQQLAQGNFQVEVPEFRGGELGELGRTLRTTSEQLRSMFEQLQQERSRFEAAINGIGEGVLVADQSLRTILFNPALPKMMPRETFDIGRSLEQCSHAEIAR